MINYLRVTYIVSQILIWYETKKSLMILDMSISILTYQIILNGWYN
jgi:hypothetical protein